MVNLIPQESDLLQRYELRKSCFPLMNRSLQAPHISCTPMSWDRICLGRCIRRAEPNYECYFNASETNSAHLWSPISMSIDTHFRHHQATKDPLQGLSYDSTSQLPSNHIHYVRPPWHHAARYPENCQWASCHEGFYSCDVLAHWEDVHLASINTLWKQQPVGSKRSFCLWGGCHKEFKRASDLDRHVQSIHLGLHSNCRVIGCHNNRGRGFSRPDKLRDHEKKLHSMG
jgi:hypothetical protein